MIEIWKLRFGLDIFILFFSINAKERNMNGGGGGGDGAASSGGGPPPPLEWRFSQVFGERTAGEEVQEGNTLREEICFRSGGCFDDLRI